MKLETTEIKKVFRQVSPLEKIIITVPADEEIEKFIDSAIVETSVEIVKGKLVIRIFDSDR